MSEEKRVEILRKAKFNIEVAVNLLDQAANGSVSGEETIMFERTMNDLNYAKLRIASLCEEITVNIRKNS
jgi:hypothetical protein